MLAVKVLKIPERDKGVWLFVSMLSNNGFMGLPLALSLFGNEGMFLMSISNVVTNFLIFSVGIKLLTQGYPVKEKINLKKMVINNINIAVILGLISYFTQMKLPEMVTGTLGYVGSITAGLSMITVGLSMSKVNVSEMLKFGNAYGLTALRLLVMPILTICILKILPFKVEGLLLGTIILMSALPSPSAVSIIAEQYHTNTALGSKMIFLTTLMCLVTVPIFMVLAR